MKAFRITVLPLSLFFVFLVRGAECPPGTFGVTAPGDCLGVVVECIGIPPLSACLGLPISQVCGCDGKTYENGCYAAANSVNINHEGPCQDEEPCEYCDCLPNQSTVNQILTNRPRFVIPGSPKSKVTRALITTLIRKRKEDRWYWKSSSRLQYSTLNSEGCVVDETKDTCLLKFKGEAESSWVYLYRGGNQTLSLTEDLNTSWHKVKVTPKQTEKDCDGKLHPQKYTVHFTQYLPYVKERVNNQNLHE